MSRPVVIIAAVAIVMLGSRSAAAATRTEAVVVRTYNSFGVPASDLSAAVRIAHALVIGAGIEIVWRDCGRCEEPLAPRELIVRLVAAPAGAGDDALGYSLIDVDRQSGSLATVFPGRIRSLADTAAVDSDVLLGRTIAHEIVHLLIGTNEHSAHGLMRARWNACDLERERHSDWMLSREEGQRMRRGLEARSPRAVASESVVAAFIRGGRGARRAAAGIDAWGAASRPRTVEIGDGRRDSDVVHLLAASAAVLVLLLGLAGWCLR